LVWSVRQRIQDVFTTSVVWPPWHVVHHEKTHNKASILPICPSRQVEKT
jgi:hypothetical protein